MFCFWRALVSDVVQVGTAKQLLKHRHLNCPSPNAFNEWGLLTAAVCGRQADVI
jgi:hypothetical protein